ncbi:TldD/PmbA family protein, partial [bacterium]|nr:TldD/PmbA family protein [bacterium]
MSRRDFFDKGSKSMLAIATVPYFLKSNVNRAFSAPASKNMTIQDYYDHFEVDAQLIHEIMVTAMSRGGDYCDLFFQHRIYNYIGLEDKAVNSAASTIDLGIGIRVLKGDQTGYSYTEEITPQAMKLAAETAANIADSGKTAAPVYVMLHETPNYYPILTPWEQVSINRKIPYLETINDKVFALDSRVIKANIIFTNESSMILIATSEGRVVFDHQPMTAISISCTAEQNGQREQNAYSLSGRQGIEFLTPENIDRLAKESVNRTVQLFDAVKPEAGEMEVVLAAGSSGILLHEAIGQGMEADFNRKKISIFSDKMNKSVAEKFVTIVDDGTNPHVRGSINVDDEANDSQKTFLVEDGILRCYLHDRISAKYYDVQ